MAIDMIKSIIGWSEYRNNGDKNVPTHKLLSNEEYEKIKNEIIELNMQLDKEKHFVKQFRHNAMEYKNNADIQAQNKIEEAYEIARAAEIERNRQISLNKNLIRINKEKNNSERNLQPKKEHTGYIVLESREKIEWCEGLRNNQSFTVWETTIQTPYKTDLTQDLVRGEIDRDLTPKEGGWLLGKLGINRIHYTDLLTIMTDNQHKEKNIAYQKQLRADFKEGYWEVIYSHTKAIRSVPINMRM